MDSESVLQEIWTPNIFVLLFLFYLPAPFWYGQCVFLFGICGGFISCLSFETGTFGLQTSDSSIEPRWHWKFMWECYT